MRRICKRASVSVVGGLLLRLCDWVVWYVVVCLNKMRGWFFVYYWGAQTGAGWPKTHVVVLNCV